MTREEREKHLDWLYRLKSEIFVFMPKDWLTPFADALNMAIKALEHPEKNVVAIVPCGDTISRQAVIDLMMQKWGENFSGDDAMQESIDAIRVMPSVTPQEPFINKPCVSSGVCEHDKQKVLDKIRTEIEKWHKEDTNWSVMRLIKIEDILDKYKAESEAQESEETETWNGIHAQITAPKGTFDRIFNDAYDDNDI